MQTSGGDLEFLKRLRAGLSRCGVPGTRVLVAVSGGPDSVALVTGIARVAVELAIGVVVGHVNHRLRSDESDQDANWVSRLADELQLPSVIQTVDVCNGGEPDGQAGSVEESARRIRYRLLIDAARSMGCTQIAVGHTANDQAETVLHHILRGTGVTGLRGIPVSRMLDDEIRLVRPMLGIDRSDVVLWLDSNSQVFRIDRTNSESVFTRNRIRNELLPQLERDFNPQLQRVLTTLATQAGEMSAFLRLQAEPLANRVLRQSSRDSLRIDCEPFQNVPPVLIRETLVLLWQRNGWPLQRMGFREWEQLAELTLNGGVTTLPNRIDARRRGALLVLQRPVAAASAQLELNS